MTIHAAESAKRIQALQNLKKGAHVHVLGVCGTGMAGIAKLLKEFGFKVTGSDKAFYPPMGDIVKKTCDKIYEGYSAENLKELPDFVAIGNSIRRDNPEAEYVLKSSLPYASMPEVFSALLIGDYSKCKTSVVITGTHGKTTTSAMTAVLLDSAGLKPGFFIGGAPRNFEESLRLVDTSIPLEKRSVVLEGDEYDSAFFAKWSKFHSYRPDILVVTSLEFDHADIFKSIEDIEFQFLELIKKVPGNGFILLCDQSEQLKKRAASWRSQTNATLLFYGNEKSSSFQLVSREPLPDGQKVTFSLQGEIITAKAKTSGEHNALNALAAAGIGKLLQLSNKEIITGTEAFLGVKRRQQVIYDKNNTLVIEDFAHHPTAVQTTLQGLRESFPTKRIIAVFEPRSNTSRRAIFQDDYAKSFKSADITMILDVQDKSSYSAFNEQFVALDVSKLVNDISQGSKKAFALNTVDEVLSKLLSLIQPNDLVVLMSNGDFGGLPKKLVESLG